MKQYRVAVFLGVLLSTTGKTRHCSSFHSAIHEVDDSCREMFVLTLHKEPPENNDVC